MIYLKPANLLTEYYVKLINITSNNQVMIKKIIILTILFIFLMNNSFAQDSKETDDIFLIYRPINEAGVITQGLAYSDKTKTSLERVNDLISLMTFEEKILLTGGWSGIKVQGSFNIPGIPRLGIRPVTMADASQGIRKIPFPSLENVSGTSFPSLLALTSTWNNELASQYGKAIGEECRALGIDILLGPGMNFYRLPTGGRHFEYLGEDPFLATPIVTEYIIGLQSQDVIATPKVALANEQEFVRHIANCQLSQRAMREIYLPPWKSAIKVAKAKAIMTGNNVLNGIPCAVNKPLLADLIRAEYGFEGIAMTDWQNTNYFPSMNNLILESGISLLMPSNRNFTNYISELTKSGQLSQAEFEKKLDKMVYYNLLPLFESGIYDRHPIDETYLQTFSSHQEFARICAEESIVLLKNKGNILPLVEGNKNILLTGGPESQSGKGSGYVTGYSHTSIYDGLLKLYGDGISYSKIPTEKEVRDAETVIFILNKEAGEGGDVPYEEPREQMDILRQILEWNRNTIVIVNACNTMPTDWVKKAKAILWIFFLGQERGNAIANILSGKVNPSGKMVFSIEKSFYDSVDPDYNFLCGTPYWRGDNSYKDYWLNGKDVKISGFSDCVKPMEPVNIPYSEDIFIGYRWYDKMKLPVLFPFGYGLSYSKFTYGRLNITNELSKGGKLVVAVRVTNEGDKTGKEISQLYISDLNNKADDRPVKELKGFSKIELKPGESRMVTFILSPNDFSVWDIVANSWKTKHGKYKILVGTSSQKLKQRAIIDF